MLPEVQLFLSRPSYPLGGTLVGTIFIQQRVKEEEASQSNQSSGSASSAGNSNEDEEHPVPPPQPSLRDILDSVTVYVAGFCKIDARWHQAEDYIKIYGRVHPYIQLLQDHFDADLLATSEDTVCFFATNGMECLSLKERKGGKWHGGQQRQKQNDDVLAFTFAVKIPDDLPHSTHAATCKYFYSCNLLIKSKTQQQIIKRGFQVTTTAGMVAAAPPQQVVMGRVKVGNCIGMAHSNGLPCHLTAAEIQRPQGQMTVSSQNRSMQYDVQTIRVASSNNNQSAQETAAGAVVCMFTLIGAQTLTPGSAVHLQWDFTGRQQHLLLPCYQVSACLQGEECALFEDGKKTIRNKSFLFDTCHEFVDPGITQTVCKTMILSSDFASNVPCNIKTDMMKVEVWCQVDITVMENDQYNNLTFRIPCRIRHWLVNEDEEMELQENQVAPLTELLGVSEETENDSTVDMFLQKDIVPDMKILAMAMEEQLQAT